MKKYLQKIYLIFMALLALISISFVILDTANEIDITKYPYVYLDNTILIIFAIDYFTRLVLAPNKREFIKHNIFDLLSIIPFNSFFSFFRVARLARLARLARIIRIVGLTGKLKNELARFFKTNGFIYLVIICFLILLAASITYSISEKVSLGEALWWSIATTTTVGYGDISPTTITGKIIATVLMFVGIGFIGMLTSSIMTFFSQKEDDDAIKEILKKLDKIEKENIELRNEVRKINRK